MNTEKILLVDCDDVLEDLCTPWVNELNKIAHTSYTVDDIQDWSLGKLFTTISESQLFGVLTEEDFWKQVKPKPGAIPYLRSLKAEGYNIYVATATHPKNFAYKIEHVLKKYFSFIPEENIIAIQKKQLLIGDFLVDDNVNNLYNGNYKKILFTAPHNRNYKEVWPYSDIYRADTWEDVYNWIHKLEDKQ